MPATQYIGARYVPKFYENSDNTSEWRSGVSYEPLTIVTYNGNSYTSKKPVPAEIGNPSDNPSYWASTGIYNEQVEMLRREVGELSEDMTELSGDVTEVSNKLDSRELNLASKKKIIFVADSFGTFTNPSFIEYAAQYLGCEYYKVAAPSYGFLASNNLTYENLLRANLPEDRESFTDMLVVGGNNDLAHDAAQLRTAINSFVAYAKEQFPNAKIHIGYNARRVNDTPNNNEAVLAYRYQTAAAELSCAYFDLRPWFHDTVMYGDANLHPNATGQMSMAQGIAQYMQTGGLEIFGGATFIGVTALGSYTISPNTLITMLDGYTLRLILSNTFMTVNNLAKNTDVDLADVTRSQFESKSVYPTRFTTPAVITLADNTEMMGVASFTIQGGKLKVRWNGTGTANAKYVMALANEFTFSIYDT